jgi:hypothetical protein
MGLGDGDGDGDGIEALFAAPLALCSCPRGSVDQAPSYKLVLPIWCAARLEVGGARSRCLYVHDCICVSSIQHAGIKYVLYLCTRVTWFGHLQIKVSDMNLSKSASTKSMWLPSLRVTLPVLTNSGCDG